MYFSEFESGYDVFRKSYDGKSIKKLPKKLEAWNHKFSKKLEAWAQK